MHKYLCVLIAMVGTLIGAPLFAGSLKVNLGPSQAVTAGAQWRVDSGAWRTSGTTVSNLASGTHVVNYKSVSGWIAPADSSVSIGSGTTTVTGTYVAPAALKVTLAPTTGQWRIDGGTWVTSGTTVTGLTPGSHAIDYKPVANYTGPSAETVTLVSGQTLTLTRSYVQLSALSITLTPTVAQWRVDGGAWRASGTTATGLTPGLHAVDYQPVANYTVPAAETVTLISGQTATLTRAYVLLAQVTVTLAPATAQWRIDGGGWLASGATATGLSAGSHLLEYATVSGYLTPVAENVSLTTGQSLALNRSYTALSSLSITLTPTVAQWRVDGGAWRASGATATGLAPGSHTVDYQPVANYTAPTAETVSLVSGQTTTLSRAYVQLAALTVTLTPAAGQWRVDGGAWQIGGATISSLTPGSHAIEYLALANYTAPFAESVALVSGQTMSIARAYVPMAQVTVTLAPATAQWRVDGGGWLASGVTAMGLSAGSHLLEYAAVSGYIAPAAENVSLATGQSLSLSRSYTELSALTLTLMPGQGQWRVDGGAWLGSGAVVANLVPGSHNVDYLPLAQYSPPSAETVSLVSGQTLSLQRSYVPLAQVLIATVPSSGSWRLNGGVWQASGASVFVLPGDYTIEYAVLPLFDAPAAETISLTPAGVFATTRYYVSQKPTLAVTLVPGQGQWRLDGGVWNASGAVVAALDAGGHTIDFTDLGGIFLPMASESITLALREHAVLSRSYSLKPASVSITLTPGTTHWRLRPSGSASAGDWTGSGVTQSGVAPGDYTIEYEALANYDAPVTEAVTLAPDQNLTLARAYVPHPAQMSVTLVPAGGSWQLVAVGSTPDGTWHGSGETVTGLAAGDYLLAFAAVEGYTTPAAESLTLTVGDNRNLTRTYAQLASLAVTLIPASGQWRADNGAWNASGATRVDLAPGSHVISYAPISDYLTPASETVTLVAGANPPLTRTYAVDPVFAVTYAFEDAGNLPTLIRGSDGLVYGAACTGSTNALGHLFRMNADGTGFQRLRNFATEAGGGYVPKALLEGRDGVLYGTLQSGIGSTATQSNGQVYRVNRDGTGFAVLCSFSQPNLGSPTTLVEGTDGVLYGTTVSGSTSGRVFRVNRDGSGFVIFLTLTTAWGTSPQGLTQTPSGMFVGTAKSGGPNSNGALFKFNADGSGYGLLKGFAGGADGADARAAVRVGSDGKLYGTTYGGGSVGRGLIYSLNADGSGYQVLHNFTGPDGAGSEFALTEDPSGVLLGCTLGGGTASRGTMFRINKDCTGYAVVHSFAGTPAEGGLPKHVLVPLGDGRYLGANTSSGGAAAGTVFSLAADGSGLTVLRSLGSATGGSPWSPVTADGHGTLFGSTTYGGANNRGVIYRLNEDGTGYTVLQSLPTAVSSMPVSGLLLASDGNLYGTAYSSNILYRLAPDGTGFTILRTFASPDALWGGVMEGTDGQLYGATGGSVYRIAKDGSGYQSLHTFAGGATDGTWSMSKMVQGADGRLYGTTDLGGAANVGTVFAVAKDGTGYTVLRQFAGGATDGAEPMAEVLQGSNGVLYGTTYYGGPANTGTLFRLNADGTGYAVLKFFGAGATDSSQPAIGGLVERNGYLYGISTAGGAFGKGTLYRLLLDGTGFEILVNFGVSGSDAAYPYAGLVIGSDGRFYGTSNQGPVAGTVYRFRAN